jgi:hypothetical protein
VGATYPKKAVFVWDSTHHSPVLLALRIGLAEEGTEIGRAILHN